VIVVPTGAMVHPPPARGWRHLKAEQVTPEIVVRPRSEASISDEIEH
jgi:hypothetical protein